jgi:hypothetical protein
MKLEVTNMASLVAPEGCPDQLHDLFMVSAEYDNRLQQATGAFINRVIDQYLSGSAQPEDLYDATLVRLYTSLISEYAQPQTPNELMHACYIMTRAIGQIQHYTRSSKIQVRVQPSPSFCRNSNATA